MKSSARIPLSIAIFLIASLACNVTFSTPSDQPNLVFTAAAQTVAAVQASLVPASSPTSGVVVPPPAPTNTSVPAATFAPLPTLTFAPPAATQVCDQAAFVSDVSIPDGTLMSQGQVFQKTWRLKNVGACTWASSYKVVFSSGPAMAGQAQQPLGTSVAPGETVDIKVDMTAPAANGNYTEYWKLRNDSGVAFTQFYVQIAVQGGVGETAVALHNISSESGQVRTDGTVLLPTNVGDVSTNHGMQAFFSFDISGIPNSATIIEVVVNFSSFDMLGNPFSVGDDGCVRAFVADYGALSASDYEGGIPTGALIKWCSAAQLVSPSADEDFTQSIQLHVSNGASRFQLRLQFRPPPFPASNFDGVADAIRFGIVTLTVTYH